jgi:hypothetical protein
VSESGAERIAVSGRVAASASEIFAVVAHPEGHVEIDGSGMLQAAPDARPFTAVGDKFTIDMDREPLGDFPMGKYTVHNAVTRLVPDRLIEWNIGLAEDQALGHVYGWELEPVSDTETDVTNYCDWSNLGDQLRGRLAFPVVPITMLEQSVANLQRLMRERATPAQ